MATLDSVPGVHHVVCPSQCQLQLNINSHLYEPIGEDAEEGRIELAFLTNFRH